MPRRRLRGIYFSMSMSRECHLSKVIPFARVSRFVREVRVPMFYLDYVWNYYRYHTILVAVRLVMILLELLEFNSLAALFKSTSYLSLNMSMWRNSYTACSRNNQVTFAGRREWWAKWGVRKLRNAPDGWSAKVFVDRTVCYESVLRRRCVTQRVGIGR